MRFSIRDLMLLPLIGFAAVPIVITATFVGMMLLPQFMANGSEIRDWFIDRGFSVDFVCGHLTFFAGQIPTILVLALLAAFLFAMQTRLCDQTAVVTLVSLPFVDAIQIGMISNDFNVNGVRTNLGLHYLTTQSLTVVTLAAIIIVYVLARWRIPNPLPTRTRAAISTTSLALKRNKGSGLFLSIEAKKRPDPFLALATCAVKSQPSGPWR